MTSISFSHDLTLASASLLEIATSGALDEISNSSGAIRNFIRHQGLVQGGVTRKSLFFVIYQTGRHGPQNGFRLCLVHEGFEIGEEDEVEGAWKAALNGAEGPIAQEAKEFIRLGVAQPAIQDA